MQRVWRFDGAPATSDHGARAVWHGERVSDSAVPAKVRDLRVCFVGDSYVAGVGDTAGLGWVGRLAGHKEYFEAVRDPLMHFLTMP